MWKERENPRGKSGKAFGISTSNFPRKWNYLSLARKNLYSLERDTQLLLQQFSDRSSSHQRSKRSTPDPPDLVTLRKIAALLCALTWYIADLDTEIGEGRKSFDRKDRRPENASGEDLALQPLFIHRWLRTDPLAKSSDRKPDTFPERDKLSMLVLSERICLRWTIRNEKQPVCEICSRYNQISGDVSERIREKVKKL